MSAITPDTDVILLKVPLEITQENQLTFSNATAQYNYFHNLPRLELEDFTYQRKDGVIRCGILADDLYQYNYVMYRNNGFSNKWFYAFIDKVEYLNHNTSAISIRTDVWQSWQFDLDYKPTFVEREHVNDDTIGAHTVPEDLETGELVANGSLIEMDLDGSSGQSTNVGLICFAVSDFPDGQGALNPGLGDDPVGKIFNGVYSGLSIIGVLSSEHANRLIHCYDLAQKGDAIYSIFMLPLSAMKSEDWSGVNHTDPQDRLITIFEYNSDDYNSFLLDSVSVTRPNTLDGYSPKNNKMHTHPFSYFYATNNSGSQTEFRWEDFSSTPTFEAYGAITQGMSVKCIPTNYKRLTGKACWDYGLSGQKYPVCSWTTDTYINWLTQNGLNTAIQSGIGLAETGLSAVGNLQAGSLTGVAGSALSAFGQVVNAVHTFQSHQRMPDQAKGSINTGDVNMGSTKMGFAFYRMSVRYELAKICDDYFSMYGYRVNSVKVPNVTGRTNWNYVKTIGCYIKADIPQEDLKEIKDMFNNGVTFWHNPATFADYSQNNAIVV